ncbi:MAG: hypothetical protein R3B84_17845 [Zavarzinella sp.]
MLLPTKRIDFLSMLLVGLIWQLTPQSARGDEASPTLAELHQQYKKLGLPLPPKGSKLVRYYSGDIIEDINHPMPQYDLAFLMKPATKDEDPIVLRATLQHDCALKEIIEIPPHFEKIIKFDLRDEQLLIYAIQCHELGLNELSKRMFDESKKRIKQPQFKVLLENAWDYYDALLIHPTIDRKFAYLGMMHLMKEDQDFDTKENRDLLRSLELALIPSTAKPGSIESLIDQLVDYHEITGDTAGFGGFTKQLYLQIACLGFEAIPVLIKHLDDERLTRARDYDVKRNPRIKTWKVRDIVCDLLAKLSGNRLPRETESGEIFYEEWRTSHYRLNKAAVNKWWIETSKKNEADYMAEFVMPPVDKKKEFLYLNTILLYVIQKKYPNQLPVIYRNLLEKRPEVDSTEIATALMKSKLLEKDKVAIFTLAARHSKLEHRYDALDALSQMEQQPKFDELLLDTLVHFPKSLVGRTAFRIELSIMKLSVQSNKPKTLQIVSKLLTECPCLFRMCVLRELGEVEMEYVLSDDEMLDDIPQRLRLFQAFLQDQEIPTFEDPPECAVEKIEVRNHAALQIAAVLKIKTKLNATSTPKQWATFREKMNQAAELELKKK